MRILSGIFALMLLAIGNPVSAGTIDVVNGTDDQGRATALWLEMLDRRLPDTDYQAVAGIEKPYTEKEQAWAKLIRERAADWHTEIPALAKLFEPVAAPKKVTVVLGNRGAEDAFSHKPFAIGFDLAAMQRVYGDANKPGAAERLDRFFRHEYVHLLQHAWWQEHPYDMSRPLNYALAEIWAEGLGNYFSLSERWQSKNGQESKTTRETLDILEPRFVARMAALACATPEQAKRLTADLSWGRFDQKWGALTAALWLEAETETENDLNALRELILAGPDGVWDIASRRLPDDLKRTLTEARDLAALCETESGFNGQSVVQPRR